MTRTHYITITTFALSLLLLVPMIAQAANEPGWFVSMLWSFVVGVFGRILGLAGLALDWGINEYVIGFADNFLKDGIGASVDILWGTVRDIFNLTFIFGLVLIGLKMILNSDDPGTRRWLVSLIMAALLVNFSLLITKAVVDFSNITATQIAQGLGTNTSGDVAVSASFMDVFGIQGIIHLQDKALPNNGTTGSQFAYIFGTMILFIVTTFVFAAGAIMLFIRYAVLCLYMALSPLMFLSWVFPQMQSLTSKYWQGFLGRAFFAPVYLLLVYFAMYILGSWKKLSGANAAYSETFAGNGDATMQTFSSTLPPFILACIFMLAAVIVANKMGADGASTVMGVGKNLQGRAQRRLQQAAVRTSKFAAANTAGRGARRLSYATGAALDRQINRMQNADKNTLRGKAARYIGNSVVADDFRKGSVQNMKNAKFGMKYTRDEQQARRDTINAQVSANDTVATGIDARHTLRLHTDREDIKKRGQEAEQKLAAGNVSAEEQTKLQAQIAEMRELDALPELSEEDVKKLNADVAKMQSQIGSLTSEQLERMFTQRTSDFAEIVGQLKGGQYDTLANSKNFTQAQKDHLSELRTDALKAAVVKSGEVSLKALENLTTKQIENLGDDFIRENAHKLTQKQMDDLVKSDNLTDGQKGDYLGARKTKMIEAFEGAELETFFANRKPAEIANVPFEAFVKDGIANDAAINKLKGQHLEEMYKKLDAEQRELLMKEIKRVGSNEAKNYLKGYNVARNWNNTEVLNQQQPPQPPQPIDSGSQAAQNDPVRPGYERRDSGLDVPRQR